MLIQEYYKQTIQFVNSLIIKIDEISIHQNYHTYVKFGLVPPEKNGSKYYQNISGMLNKNDIPAKININTLLTREYLNDNYYIKNNLLKYGTTYNKLIKDNPGMSDYVRGCLTTLNIDDVIKSDNYKVLSYIDGFLSTNETIIIKDIEDYVEIFMTKYNNKKYFIDELFLPTQLASLYSTLVLIIISKKFGNIKTNKVDSFHLTSHLQSYKNLYNDSKIFDLKTNIYLYGNINRIKHSIGKKEIFSEILNSVYDVNDIGIANLNITNNLPTIIDENLLDHRYEYYNSNYGINVKPVNTSLFNIKDKTYTLDTMLTTLENNELIDTNNKLTYDLLDKEFSLDNSISNTNVFMIDRPEKISVNVTNMFVFLISNILDKLHDNEYLFLLDYLDSSNTIQTLSMKDVESLIVYMLSDIYDTKTQYIEIVCNNIYTKNSNNDILSKTWYKDKITPVLDYLTNNSILDTSIFNLDTLSKYLLAVRELDTKVWFTLSNIVDNTAKADVLIMGAKLLTNRNIIYDLNNIESYLVNRGLIKNNIIFSIEDLSDLLNKLTGITVDSRDIIKERFKRIKSFFNKTTSYKIDLLTDNTFLEKDIVNDSSSEINIGYKPFIQINDVSIKMYDELNVYLLSTGFIDFDLKVFYGNNDIIHTNYIDSLPCISDTDNFKNRHTASKSKRLFGKTYAIQNVANVLKDGDIDIITDSTTNVFGIRNGLPIINIENTLLSNNIHVVSQYSNFKAKDYIIKNSKAYSVHDRDNIDMMDTTNINNIKSSGMIKPITLTDLNIEYSTSKISRTNDNKLTVDSKSKVITPDNTIELADSNITQITKSATVGNIKIIPYETVEDGVTIETNVT